MPKKSLIKRITLIRGVITIALGLNSVSYSQFPIVGYYPSWMRNVLTAGQFEWAHLTHIVQAFAWPLSNGNIANYSDLLYPELVNQAHAAGKKVLIAFGGWGQSDGFSPMVADTIARKNFIENVITFCETNGFDGVDLDWEYPATPADRQNLNHLVKELREAFTDRQKDWLITMAIPAGDWAGQWFDYATLQNYLDWIGCMTYDFMGSWVSVATHNAPLYPHPQNPQGSVDASIQYLTTIRRITPSKILVGLPFYGRGCNATGLFQPNTGGNVEYYYSQIIPKIGNGWNDYWDDVSQTPYLLNVTQTQFITFDDTQAVHLKCEYVRTQELGGVMIWALGYDKIGFHQPLLETVARYLQPEAQIRMAPETSSGLALISSCYPNPFNERATIQFFLPYNDNIHLEVFDITGRSIEMILNQSVSSGWHQVQFGTRGLPAGLYLYRLTGTGYSKTGKIISLQ